MLMYIVAAALVSAALAQTSPMFLREQSSRAGLRLVR